MKDNQIADLRNQLEKAEAQLHIATTEKTKLLDLLSAERFAATSRTGTAFPCETLTGRYGSIHPITDKRDARGEMGSLPPT